MSKVTANEESKSRKFLQEDLIPCKSIVSGGLYVEGARSKMLYTWADYDDVVEVEYRDLLFMVRSRENSTIYEPRIIVLDNDFISQNKALADFYESMYTTDDLREIIKLPVPKMKKEIEKLPEGIRNAIKGLAATMIDTRTLDSVQKIKALDEIFGTSMLLTLVQE